MVVTSSGRTPSGSVTPSGRTESTVFSRLLTVWTFTAASALSVRLPTVTVALFVSCRPERSPGRPV